MTFTVHYSRYGVQMTQDAETLHKALRWVGAQEDLGEIAAYKITQDGRVVVDDRDRLCDMAWDAYDGIIDVDGVVEVDR